jgi:hypothetical protein
MEATDNYELFKFMDGNRPINSKHIYNLIESIKKENLLYIRPILVDEEMHILDGQHRFEAAKTLGVKVYFIKIKSENHSEILRLNQNNKNWKILDFLNFHSVKSKNKNYLKIIQIMNTYGWNLSDFFIYSSYSIRKKSLREEFENGLFEIKTSDEVYLDYFSKWKTLKDFLSSKAIDHIDCVDSQCFKESFMFFHNSKIIKMDQFWEKLRANVTIFHRCMNKDEYIDMFLRIYNNGCTYKIEKGML